MLIVILTLGCLAPRERTPYEKYYAGDIRHFRANLKEAEKILVYPDELTLKNIFLDPEVKKIYISFIPNETENSFYFASTFEITNKLTIIFRYNFQGENYIDIYSTEDGSTCLVFYSREIGDVLMEKCFKSLPLNSTSDAFQIAKRTEPVILLLGPSQTNSTMVSIRDYVITAEGRDFSEVDRTYTDLDLSVDKILLVLMD